MTARFYPGEPEFEHPTERAVWETLLAQLPDEAAVLANLRFVDRKGDHEADMVVAIPGAGVAVLEVKGGSVTYDGVTWRQSGRTQQDQPINPAEQARRAMYALRNHLDRDPRWHRRRVRFGHLVVLPTSSIAEDVNPTDCPRWIDRDRDRDRDQLGSLVSRVLDVVQRQESEKPLASQADGGRARTAALS